ncbi:MAG: helix-turn-helix domain-containing protein [Lachnospiraceae bacterium]|nr:helix-turn-helix domain-containing protein [Lachnospiraceae bacterium]
MISRQDLGLQLKTIRETRNITQLELSNMLGISRQAYSNYEQGVRTPDTGTLAKLSNILGINLFDYFTNQSDTQNDDEDLTSSIPKVNLMPEKLASFLKHKREEYSLSQNDVADIIGLSRTTYSRYELGTRTPSLESLLNLSTFYRINPMELICALIPAKELSSAPEYKNFKCYSNDDLSLSDQQLLQNYKKLSQNQKDAINNLINTFL